MSDSANNQYVGVRFDERLLTRVDDFRFKQRFVSRTEAIRWLIKAALDAKLVPREGGS
jgi:metal-responsive CopG/Arc/MetJ family transcriptional regulator